MEIIEKPNKNKFGNWIKTSITARMLMVGALVLILLIPLIYIEDLIRERSMRQQSVINEINQQWGNEVLLNGPVLQIPYKIINEKTITDANTKQVFTETVEEIKHAYFFPDRLNFKTKINPEEKKRGIYSTAVYNSKVNISGNFTKPDFSEIEISDEQILWSKAKLVIQTSNLKGVSEASVLLNSTNYEVISKYNGNSNNNDLYNAEVRLHNLETKALDVDFSSLKKPINFDIQLNIKGSEQMRFIPLGKETNAEVTSNWKNANFFGEFLPFNDNKINDNGFNAKWKILDINRAFAQNHFEYLPDFREFAFGVNFMIPIDQYQQSERSVKYGFLVIALTFLIFFLIQTLSKIQIHPFQYLMIGLALTMFYTLLISISEHSTFKSAYLIAGIAVVILITLYSKSILKSPRFTAFIFTSLSALYGFIYVIIQLENYALLVGSIGLFLILATVMYVSKKIDWQNG